MRVTAAFLEDPDRWVMVPPTVSYLALPILSAELRRWLDERTPHWKLAWGMHRFLSLSYAGPSTCETVFVPAFHFACVEHTVMFRLGWNEDDLAQHLQTGPQRRSM